MRERGGGTTKAGKVAYTLGSVRAEKMGVRGAEDVEPVEATVVAPKWFLFKDLR